MTRLLGAEGAVFAAQYPQPSDISPLAAGVLGHQKARSPSPCREIERAVQALAYCWDYRVPVMSPVSLNGHVTEGP